MYCRLQSVAADDTEIDSRLVRHAYVRHRVVGFSVLLGTCRIIITPGINELQFEYLLIAAKHHLACVTVMGRMICALF